MSQRPPDSDEYLALQQRAGDLEAELHLLLNSDLPQLTQAEQIAEICVLMNAVFRQAVQAGYVSFPEGHETEAEVDIEALRKNLALIRELQRPPTTEEQALRALADKLEAKCQTVLPDFDSFYRQRAELEARMHERE